MWEHVADTTIVNEGSRFQSTSTVSAKIFRNSSSTYFLLQLFRLFKLVQFLVELHIFERLPGASLWVSSYLRVKEKQECLPVGCVLPALVAVSTGGGVSVCDSKGRLLLGQGDVPLSSRGVSASRSGGVYHTPPSPHTPLWTHKHLWKHYFAPNFVCGR